MGIAAEIDPNPIKRAWDIQEAPVFPTYFTFNYILSLKL